MILTAADLAALVLSLLAMRGIFHMSGLVSAPEGYWQEYLKLAAILLLIPVCFLFAGLYPGYGLEPVEQLRRRTLAIGALFIFVLSLMLAGIGLEPWHVQLLVTTTTISLIPAELMRRAVRQSAMKRGIWGSPATILGSDNAVNHAIQRLDAYPSIGLSPDCVIRGLDLRAGIDPILAAIDSAERNGREIGHVIVADTEYCRSDLNDLANALSHCHLSGSEGQPGSALTMHFVPY